MIRRWLKLLLRLLGILLALAIIVASGAWRFRPGMDFLAAHRYAVSPRPGELKTAWFGVSAVLLSDGDTALFIDPYFSRPEGLLRMVANQEIAPDAARIRAGLALAGVKRLDAVLASHSHFDHAMDVGVVAMQTGARVIGSASTTNIARGAGVPESRIQMIRSDEPIHIGRFTITFIESRHAGATGGTPTGEITKPLRLPAHYLDYRQGGSYSILIEHPQGNVLHHGSAGFVPGALAGKHADVVLLGVALVDDLATYLHEVVDAVGARRVLPVHWDDFTRPLDQPLSPMPVVVRLDQFFPEMASLRPGIEVQVLPLGQAVALFPVKQELRGVIRIAAPLKLRETRQGGARSTHTIR